MAFDPLSAALELGTSVLNKVWPDPIRQAEEQRKLQELYQKGDAEELSAHVQLLVGQLEINKIEAANPSLFVSGWRPAIGWVCGFALAYSAIIEPFARFVANMSGYTGSFPVIDTTLTMQVLLGMLGLVAARTREKEKGVNSI